MRTVLKNESFVAYRKAVETEDFNKFKRHMKPVVRKYERINTPLVRRIVRKLKRLIKRVLPDAVVASIKGLLQR